MRDGRGACAVRHRGRARENACVFHIAKCIMARSLVRCQVLIGWLGRYGIGARNVLPDWIDILVVIISHSRSSTGLSASRRINGRPQQLSRETQRNFMTTD